MGFCNTVNAQVSLERFFKEMVDGDTSQPEEEKEAIFEKIENRYQDGKPAKKSKNAENEISETDSIVEQIAGASDENDTPKEKKKSLKAPKSSKKDQVGDMVGEFPTESAPATISHAKKSKSGSSKLLPPDTIPLPQISGLEGGAGKLLKTGIQLGDSSQPFSSVAYLLAAWQKNTKNQKATKAVADAYYRVRDYEKAAYFYKLLLFSDPNSKKYPETLYFLGLSEKGNNQFKSSIDYLRQFNNLPLKGTEWSDIKLSAREGIRGAQMALEELEMLLPGASAYEAAIVKASDVEIRRDFTPETADKDLLFQDVHRLNPMPSSEKTYIAQLYPSYSYMGDNPISKSYFNIEKPYLGQFSKSAYGKAIYFTRCEKWESEGFKCKLFMSTVNGSGSLTETLLDNVNLPGSNAAFPFVAVDDEGNEVLYFSSDRMGGKGGYDIWNAILDKNGIPGKAYNVGIPVNSKGDEISPVYDYNEHALMFSSDGHIGYGGFDIYKVLKNGKYFSDISHYPFPLNSAQDEAFHFFDKESRTGYLITNRPDTLNGARETVLDRVFEIRRKLADVVVMGKVYTKDNANVEQVMSADLDVYKENESQIIATTSTIESKYQTTLLEGDRYTIKSFVEGWEPVEKMIDVIEANWKDTLVVDFIHSDKEKPKSGRLLAVIYFDYDQFRLRSDAPFILNQMLEFMRENPTVKVEIGGHTDSKGSVEYNLALSDNRASAVRRYFLSKGIRSNVISAVGFGESQPFAPNTKENGEDDETGRALNRRVEFKVAND